MRQKYGLGEGDRAPREASRPRCGLGLGASDNRPIKVSRRALEKIGPRTFPRANLLSGRSNTIYDPIRRQEKPQSGNPQGLAIDLHVLPVASIARFCSADGYVYLHDLMCNRVRRVRPKDSIFCACRAWDHGSETGFMKNIEDAFQDLAEKTIGERTTTIADDDKRVVDEFFATWYFRSKHRTLATQEIQAKTPSSSPLADYTGSLHVPANKRIKLRFGLTVALIILRVHQPTVGLYFPMYLGLRRPPRKLSISPTFIRIEKRSDLKACIASTDTKYF